ncbi:MAG: HlyC/CorC family transporter [Leptospiraceae bacterium]|nr:HlyC/CorC family transporter [Leptospiraceae bacterium]MCB1302786.1 HlyC/CorC family transporter [Leptospiraceae bacterium]
MGSPTLDFFIIVILILINGFFAAAEIALISIRKGRVKALMEEGNARARIISRLQGDPDRLFATVQVGVTLVGTIASVFGGSSFVKKVEPILASIPNAYVQQFSEQIAFALVVMFITYFSLVVGELVPKSLALNYSERVGMLVAYPLQAFNRVVYWFTRFLTFSSNLLLRPFKDRTSFSETRLLAEEIKHLLEEGVRHGTIAHSEHEIIENVLEINDTAAREVMVPRVDIKAISVDAADEEIRKAVDSLYSRLPVYGEGLDNIIGILHMKDLMRCLARQEPYQLSRLARPAYFVPESMKIGKILQEMQKRKTHMAIVVDEYGGTAGLLTMEDILEEIVGEIQDVTEIPDEDEFLPLPDGSYLVSGSCGISDFNEFMKEGLPEADSYTSVAGFVIEQIGRFPEVGEKIVSGNLSFELVKRVRQKMVQFRVRRLEPPPEE